MFSVTAPLFTNDPFPLLRTNYPNTFNRNRNLFTIRSCSSLQVAPINEVSEDREKLSSKLRDSIPFPAIREAKRVVLVRHGQSTWNEEGRIQGSSDFSVLTQKGESQAETSRQMLIDDSFDICFSRYIT